MNIVLWILQVLLAAAILEVIALLAEARAQLCRAAPFASLA